MQFALILICLPFLVLNKICFLRTFVAQTFGTSCLAEHGLCSLARRDTASTNDMRQACRCFPFAYWSWRRFIRDRPNSRRGSLQYLMQKPRSSLGFVDQFFQ